ncbi:MAG: hypothetical protein U0412_05875 [Nitrospira sp.]
MRWKSEHDQSLLVFVHGIGGTVRDFDAIVVAPTCAVSPPLWFLLINRATLDQLAATARSSPER